MPKAAMPKAGWKGRQVRRWPPKINYMYEYATMVNGKPEGPITNEDHGSGRPTTWSVIDFGLCVLELYILY